MFIVVYIVQDMNILPRLGVQQISGNSAHLTIDSAKRAIEDTRKILAPQNCRIISASILDVNTSTGSVSFVHKE